MRRFETKFEKEDDSMKNEQTLQRLYYESKIPTTVPQKKTVQAKGSQICFILFVCETTELPKNYSHLIDFKEFKIPTPTVRKF